MNTNPLVRERVLEYLRKYIQQMRSDNFVRIESERALAENLGVSRVSIRNAIKVLCEEGLLSQTKGSGTYITPNIWFHTINVILSNDIKYNDPFYMNLIAELNSMCARLSVSLNLVMLEPSGEFFCHDRSIVVVIGHINQDAMDKVVKSFDKVVVLFDNLQNDQVTQIAYDDYDIGKHAAKLLHQHDHRKILLLAGPDKYVSSCSRRLGFLSAAEEYGIETDVIFQKMNWSGGFECSKAFSEKYSDRSSRPTGAFATNDWMAIGFIQGLKDAGISVPNDVSVIGCDDIPMATEYQPLLSTFNLDAKKVVEELYYLLNNKNAGALSVNRKILLNAKFINRKTLRNPAEKQH